MQAALSSEQAHCTINMLESNQQDALLKPTFIHSVSQSVS
jgi:hypothetical protein